MRLKKCLVILPLLALTLSGCNDTKVSDSPESSSSSESEQTSGEITALSNYTLSFTFYSSGVKSSIPDYASAYIIGDWDWNTFLPLKEADGVYSYTFSSIEVGTHEYKGVMWYSDETVSWTNCVEIITQGTENATFTVKDSDGDGYTQYIDCTLNATLEPKSTEKGEGEDSSSDTTTEGPTTGGSSTEEPGTGGSSSSGENPGTGEGSSSDSSSGSGSGNPEEPGTGDSSSSSEDKGTGESSSGDGSTSSGNTGEGETNYTYAIEVADEDSYKSLEYNGTPFCIDLVITLYAYNESHEVVYSKTATADDVTFSGYDSSIITINSAVAESLKATIVGAGSTSLTISWANYDTKTIEIIVSDTTGGDEEEGEENPSGTTATLYFNFTYQEVSQTLTTGSLFIAGAWDNDNDWKAEDAIALTYDNQNTVYYAEITLDGETDIMDGHWYTYDIYLVGETTFTWEVAKTKLNAEHLWWTYAEGSLTKSETIVLTDTFDNLLENLEDTSEETTSLGTSITLYFTFTYGGQAQTLTDYEQIYLNGGWDNNENWDVTTTLSYDEASQQYYTTITYGEDEDVYGHWFKFNLILEYSDAAFSWGEDAIVLLGEDGDFWTYESEVATASYTVELTDSFSNLLEDRGAAAITYVITIKHDGTALEAAPEGLNLYAAGSFNGTWNDTEPSGWWNWNDPTLLENNGNGTYNLVLYEVPQSGQTIEILVDDTTDLTQDMWNSILVSEYTLTATDVDTSSSKTISLELTTSYDGWYTDNGIFPPVGTEEEEFYVAFVNGNTGDYNGEMTFTADIDCWTDGSSTASHTTVSDGHYAFYSGAGKSVSGVSTNFELSSNGHSFKTNSAVTIPTNSEGTPIYIGICWVDGWQADTTYLTWDVDTSLGVWAYIPQGTTVEAFLNSYTVSAYY